MYNFIFLIIFFSYILYSSKKLLKINNKKNIRRNENFIVYKNINYYNINNDFTDYNDDFTDNNDDFIDNNDYFIRNNVYNIYSITIHKNNTIFQVIN